MDQKIRRIHHHAKRVWHFFWKDDSIWSWIANLVVAFLVIYYIVYPLLGIILGTSYPIVAVISESMDHGPRKGVICGQHLDPFHHSFDNYWDVCGEWYEENDISKEQFREFPFKNGFYKGDVIILWRANANNLEVGDVLVFKGSKYQPIIHRVVKVWQEEGNNYYQTKGDHNRDLLIDGSESMIGEERVFGQGLFRVPYLGWLKILFVDAVKPLGINIER